MALIPYAAPATEQPQGATPEIDWANPLNEGAGFCAPLSDGFSDIVGGTRSGTINGTVIEAPTAEGRGAKFDGSSYLDYGSGDLISSTSPFTITLYEETDVTSGYNSLFAFSAGGTRFVMYRGTGASYTCAIGPLNGGATVREFNSLGAQTAGERIRFVITGTGGLGSATGLRLWANGVEQTSITTNLSSSGGNNSIGWGGVNSKFNGKLSDVNLYPRVWTDEEITSYFERPGQVYRGGSVLVPVSTGGGPTYTLAADGAAFTLSGGSASLIAARKLSASGGDFALTGGSAALKAGRKIAADGGSFSLTGGDAALKAARKLSADGGSFAFTGGDASLVYTPVGGPTYTLVADGGSFALSGGSAALVVARKLVAGGGDFALTGGDADFVLNPVVPEPDGVVSLGGRRRARRDWRSFDVMPQWTPPDADGEMSDGEPVKPAEEVESPKVRSALSALLDGPFDEPAPVDQPHAVEPEPEPVAAIEQVPEAKPITLAGVMAADDLTHAEIVQAIKLLAIAQSGGLIRSPRIALTRVKRPRD